MKSSLQVPGENECVPEVTKGKEIEFFKTESYLNKLVECKVKFYQIGEAYESQTVNLHKSASWSSNALQIGKAKTGEMASTQKGNIISTDVEDLQSWKLRVKALQSVSQGT